MKRLLYVMLGVLILFSTALPQLQALPQPVNLIQNGSFEVGAANPDYWRFFDTYGGSWDWDTTDKVDGEKSLKLILTDSTQRSIMEQNHIPVQANSSYDLSFFYRTQDLKARAFIHVIWYDSSDSIIGSGQQLDVDPNQNDWTLVTETLTAPENTAYVRIQLYTRGGTGSIWYDQITLSENEDGDPGSGDPNPGNDLNLIQNPSFEEGTSAPNHWRFLNAYLGEWNWDTSNKVDGAKSVKLTLTDTSQRSIFDQSNIEVTEGKSYKLQFHYRTEDLDANAFVRLAWFDADNQLISPAEDFMVNPDQEEWTQVSDVVHAPPQTAHLKVQLYAFRGTGSVWFDHLELLEMEETEQAEIPVQPETIYNLSLLYAMENTAQTAAIKVAWFDAEDSLIRTNLFVLDEQSTDLTEFSSRLLSPDQAAFARVLTSQWTGDGNVSFENISLSQSTDSNLVLNSGFETGQDVPANWIFNHLGTGGDWVWNEEESYEGSKSVQLQVTGPDQSALLEQTGIPIIEQQYYHVRFAYRTPEGTAEPVVQVVWLDSNGNALDKNDITLQKQIEWTEADQHVHAPPGTAFAKLVLKLSNGIGSVLYDNVEMEKADGTFLLSALGEPIPVSEVEDINEPLPPEQFWSKFPEIELNPPTESIWTVDTLRNFFQGFGKTAGGNFQFHVADRVAERDLHIPIVEGALGQQADEFQPIVIAGDIDFRPFMTAHANYSDKYYPRRMNDYLQADYIPAYVLTGDEKFKLRAEELIEYLHFSQWTKQGENAFTSKYFPEEYAIHPEWAGGWDYLFDWVWNDAYGYTWHLHEPDHHVNGLIAVSLLHAMETFDLDKERVIDKVRDFIYYQTPRYGFHKGVWNGDTYYWTEYNPTGETEGNPTEDATDNIVALAAMAQAAMGYYESDPVMKRRYLESARGMLWYLIREFTYDGRFYYDGAENPLNPRKVISHDVPSLVPGFIALAYLYKAGVDVDKLLEHYAKIDEAYLNIWNHKVDLHKMYDGDPQPNSELTISTFIQMKNNSFDQASFSDTISPGFVVPDEMDIRVSELVPPNEQNQNWTVDEVNDVMLKLTPEQLENGFEFPFSLKPFTTYKITYQLTTEPNFKLETGEGTYRVKDLLPPIDSSDKEYKLVLDDAVFYRAEEPGDFITLSVEVAEEGDYTISTSFVQSPAYGKVQVYVNDEPIGDVYNGYNAEVRIGGAHVLGDIHLKAGEHTIRFENVGKDDNSTNFFMGLDKIVITPATDDVGSELMGSWLSTEEGEFSSDTLSLATKSNVTSENFLSFNARTMFPFAEEVSTKLVEREFKRPEMKQLTFLQETTEQYVDEGQLKGPLAQPLLNRLRQAQHHLERGNEAQALHQVEKFLGHLNKPSLQKHGSKQAIEELNEGARLLLSIL